MKIALAQIESIDAEVDANIARHLAALRHLRSGDADLVIFPELSLTNYAPAIAAAAAIAPDDSRLAPFDDAAKALNASVCVGAPLETGGKPSISAIRFSPAEPRRVVHKAYLHEDELPLFAPGVERASLLAPRIVLAICHDISVDAHIEQAAVEGMEVYVASVAKTVEGIAAACERLRGKACEYAVPVLVVNSVGSCEGKPAGGGSMVIASDGSVVDVLDETEQALLIYDAARGLTRRLTLENLP